MVPAMHRTHCIATGLMAAVVRQHTAAPFLHSVSCLADLQAAAALLQAYPPRGTLNLQLSVDKQPVTSLMSRIDRIVIQDYVIDTIHYFDGDNNELARRLGIGADYLALSSVLCG